MTKLFLIFQLNNIKINLVFFSQEITSSTSPKQAQSNVETF